ncbi:MAG: cation:proton antiporter [Steroidobacteraceae bacterium]|nr:cation:proton antiporter [Steroidobacteraceae bacterium]MDW8258933.1 cation:proton antiporter [Gammaproteobacteria bacterium]
MIGDPLAQILLLLGASVFVVALARRLGLPPVLGYLAVGLALGPYALGVLSEGRMTTLLAELGVAFLLFTLGLEFSWPRMVAMRREVFGLGAAQVTVSTLVVASLAVLFGVPWLPAIAIGGALAMSSTVLIVQQLRDLAELNRTHGRLAFSVLLFQDLAVVPFLALAAALGRGGADFSLSGSAAAVGAAVIAVLLVLLIGRYLLRPLLYEIAHSRLRELFTLTVLLVAMSAAWVSHRAGLSMATGAFLAGVMLAETEYRHQVDAVIRPFRDILLGLFFISVGMLLDLRLLAAEFWLVAALLLAMLVLRATLMALVTMAFGVPPFKAVRAGVVMSIGGEFGIALLTILLKGKVVAPEIVQPLLVATVVSMTIGALILRHNKRIARWVLREPAPLRADLPIDLAANVDLAKREHVILCGFGRVGQNVARVLEAQGFEYLALDLDPTRVRLARQAGDPVVYGDSADEDVLRTVGIDKASALIVSFSDPATALAIVRTVRRLRSDLPVLVRTQDDTKVEELKAAGATEVVPETFEASLMLVSHALLLLRVPMSRIVRTIGAVRSDRYALLRNIVRRGDALPIDESHSYREELQSVVLPPGAWAVGRRLADVRAAGAEVIFTAVRRNGILGREPDPEMRLREGDVVVLYGLPEALEHAEAVLLTGS